MKKIYSILLIIVCLLFSPINVSAVETVDSSLKIYDYGELLTDDDEIYLKGLIDEYIEKYDMDLVIVTKKDYYGNMKRYAQDFYDYNTFGINDTHDGVLLFLNVDREGPIVEIVTTGQAILMYDDERISELMTSMRSAKTNGNKAIVEIFIRRVSKYASRGIPESNKDYHIDEKGNLKRNEKNYKPLGFVIIPIISAMITAIVVYFMSRKNNTVVASVDAAIYLDASSFKLLRDHDALISSNTYVEHIDTYSSGGHSSSSGAGSSISIGSSGTSHGGGGGRL